jgi:hypothetical protein
MTEPQDQADEPEVMCLACLVRPVKPGEVFCSWLCRVLHALRLARFTAPRPARL